MLRSFQLLPPVTWGRGLRQHRDVFGHDPRLEAGIGIGGRLRGGIGELAGIDAGQGEFRRNRAGVVGGVADLAQHVVELHQGREPQARHRAQEVASDEGNLRIRRACTFLGRRRFVVAHVGEQPLRIERRNFRRQFGRRHREVAGNLYEGPHPRHFALADLGHGGDADHMTGGIGFGDRRQAIALARSGAAAGRAAQGLDPFRIGGEMGLAVERCENGASHQGGAAQAGQDRAGEPAYRYAAPIEVFAQAAIHGQRWFVAEVDGAGHGSLRIAPRTVIQTPVPPSVRLTREPPPQPRLGPTKPIRSTFRHPAGPISRPPREPPGHSFGSKSP